MSTNFSAPTTATDILRNYWGYASFRPLQQEIIESVLNGKDVLALLPTGGGKSICYQVPGMLLPGLCLVVSPLIALMKDQVENLRKKGITAFAIYSGMSRKEVLQTMQLAIHSNCKFLYVSPERLETALFKEYLPALEISLLAVDEAHCISQWGYDFRPPYLRIADLRDELPRVPVIALTASATTTVQKDIKEKLLFKNEASYQQSFARPNLSYSVFAVDSKINKLVEVLNNVSGSGIVYCKTRRLTKEVAAQLQTYAISADYYHAGLSSDERNDKQTAWIKNQVRIMVCTNAFGMGIDKPDVRTVVHYNLPDCLENYYQEAGRAGRDGNKAYAVLLYHQGETQELLQQVNIKFPNLQYLRQVYQSVVNYLQLPTGTFENAYYNFDMGDCAKKFQLHVQELLPALKVLEQETYLGFNEQVFIPAKLQFICSKEALYQFENDYPTLEPVVKMLLRTYEGIYDQETAINEKSLAYWLKMETEAVKQQLQQLQVYGMVRYTPQKDTPQLFLLQERIKAEYLTINNKAYEERRQQYTQRVQQFINYVTNANECRSQLIGSYFGDDKVPACGVCDNCLQQKKNLPLSPAHFTAYTEKIMQLLQQPQTTANLLLALKGLNKSTAWQLLSFLQAENKIAINLQGMVTKTNN
ncbi:MAG: RecQ family ATP-dependent DNA helicase [Sphingobacteriales bacterium]|nr:MAG: RecQ family ATP-dependent DNA helicase [Sphingobacteriales bacterium]